MKQNYYIPLFFLIFFSISCDKFTEQQIISNKHNGNIFTDTIVQQIYDFQQTRNVVKLTPYLNHDSARYRRQAALAFASIQDNYALQQLCDLLQDPDTAVRQAAVFALGQIADNQAQDFLIKAFTKEHFPEINASIMEAIGKCGNEYGLDFLLSLDIKPGNLRYLQGQAWGLIRFKYRGIRNKQSDERILAFLMPSMPEKIREIASNYLIRPPELNLEIYQKQLTFLLKKETNTFIKRNLILALTGTNEPNALRIFDKIISQQPDYRVTVSIIKALENFEYDQVNDMVFNLIQHQNPNVNYTAAIFFINNGKPEEAEKYKKIAYKHDNFRTRAALLTAAMKFSSNQQTFSDSLKNLYLKTKHPYEKAALVPAFTFNLNHLDFLSQQLFAEKKYPVKTAIMNGLADMAISDFDNNNGYEHNKKEINQQFASIVKKALLSDDVALKAIAATTIRNKKIQTANWYDNYDFLYQSLNQCRLPADLEAYQEIIKTLEFLALSIPDEPIENNYKSIDWDKYVKITPGQKAIINTTKGEITIEFFINNAPGTVLNFIELAKSGYYKNKYFHRVVPDFVVQAGCNRGDGWGTINYLIRSEFSPIKYRAGYIGMASAGKDTESAQWFITQSPAHHLDGKYTVFAKVVKGMENLHQIELGDKIISIIIPHLSFSPPKAA